MRARDPLAPALVGGAHHDGVEHVGVGLEHRLDLFGEDLLAAGVDAHRAAAQQGDAPVVLDGGEVAGHRVAPAVGGHHEGGRRLGLVLVVADGDVAAPGHPADHARSPARPGCRSSSSTTVSSPGDTVGPPPFMAVSSLATVRMPVKPALGGADGVGQHQVREPLEEAVLDRRREHRGARADADEAGQVELLAARLHLVERLDEGPAHGVAHDQDGVDPVAATPRATRRRGRTSRPARCGCPGRAA